MAAGTLLSLRDLAIGFGISYQEASKQFRAVKPRIAANRTLGRPARYDWDDITAFLDARDSERIAA